jgi:glyoxylase I family protein
LARLDDDVDGAALELGEAQAKAQLVELLPRDARLVMRLLVADPPVARHELEAELGDVARLHVPHLARHEVVVEELHGAAWYEESPPACRSHVGFMRSGGVHHVDLVVSSIERSLPFYRDLLGPLGWHGISEVEGERGETIWYLLGHETQIGLREAQAPGAHDRYSVGLHHLAFEAFSRSVVDERADWLRSNGAEIESEPQDYTYSPGYYAVFFYDPDGMKLEIVHVPALAA